MQFETLQSANVLRVYYGGRRLHCHIRSLPNAKPATTVAVLITPPIASLDHSSVAQWKRAGPITQRSVDRNYSLLYFFVRSRLLSKCC